MELLIRYGPAVPGLAASFLCFSPLVPQGLLVSGQNEELRSRVGLHLSGGIFLGATCGTLETPHDVGDDGVTHTPSNPRGSLMNI